MPVESLSRGTCPILTTLHLAQAVTLKTIFCNKFKDFVLHFHITTNSALPPNQLTIFKKNFFNFFFQFLKITFLFICFLQLASPPFPSVFFTAPLLGFSILPLSWMTPDNIHGGLGEQIPNSAAAHKATPSVHAQAVPWAPAACPKHLFLHAPACCSSGFIAWLLQYPTWITKPSLWQLPH